MLLLGLRSVRCYYNKVTTLHCSKIRWHGQSDLDLIRSRFPGGNSRLRQWCVPLRRLTLDITIYVSNRFANLAMTGRGLPPEACPNRCAATRGVLSPEAKPKTFRRNFLIFFLAVFFGRLNSNVFIFRFVK